MLLIIGWGGGFAFDVMVVYAASAFINNFTKGEGSLQWNATMIVLLTSGLLNSISRILQAFVIICSQKYKCLKSNEDQISSSKIIRQHSLFMVITNLGLWGLDSFSELKDFANTSYPSGKVSLHEKWNSIISFVFPFCIFFRFHSAAMIFDLWGRFKFSPDSNTESDIKPEANSTGQEEHV